MMLSFLFLTVMVLTIVYALVTVLFVGLIPGFKMIGLSLKFLNNTELEDFCLKIGLALFKLLSLILVITVNLGLFNSIGTHYVINNWMMAGLMVSNWGYLILQILVVIGFQFIFKVLIQSFRLGIKIY